MSNQTIAWLFVVAFMVHEFEEIIFLVSWVKKHRQELLKKIPRFAVEILGGFEGLSTEGFALVVAEEFVLVSAVVFYSATTGDYSGFTAIAVVFIVHNIVHLFQGIYVKKYIPAIATGMISSVWSTWSVWYLNSQGLVGWQKTGVVAVAFTVVMVINLLAMHSLVAKLKCFSK